MNAAHPIDRFDNAVSFRLSLLTKECESRRFDAGHVIFEEGEGGSVMYVVIAGEVEVWLGGRLVETLGPGEPLGEMALIDNAPHVATVIARTSCRVAVIPEARFLSMVRKIPGFAIEIMRVMACRLRRLKALKLAQPTSRAVLGGARPSDTCARCAHAARGEPSISSSPS